MAEIMTLAAGLGSLLLCGLAPAAPAQAPSQSEADEYTRYELLAPETSQFRITYEVTAATPGATVFYNPIRRGSEASNEAVHDRLSGAPLRFEIVDGAKARAEGYSEAEPETSYIKIRLPRPVPKAAGEVRLLIDKTYKDPKSYFREADRIVFSRSLSIPRNAVVLPAGYELVACNVPSQVLRLDDGRIQVSFMNSLPAEAPLVVKARRLP
jgi:hypothetical protein